MRVAIIGSRNCKDMTVELISAKLPENCTKIISGGARGVDSLAERLAMENGIPISIYEPDYEANGKQAPLMRNIEIIKNADLVLAFWDFTSRGTAYTIVQCIERQIPVRIFKI